MIGDRDALRALGMVSDTQRVHLVTHYLYVPTVEDAHTVEYELQRRGFLVDTRLGADGMNRLILARHHVVPSQSVIATARQLMHSLAATVGGEYDGWEADVHKPNSSRPDA